MRNICIAILCMLIAFSCYKNQNVYTEEKIETVWTKDTVIHTSFISDDILGKMGKSSSTQSGLTGWSGITTPSGVYSNSCFSDEDVKRVGGTKWYEQGLGASIHCANGLKITIHRAVRKSGASWSPFTDFTWDASLQYVPLNGGIAPFYIGGKNTFKIECVGDSVKCYTNGIATSALIFPDTVTLTFMNLHIGMDIDAKLSKPLTMTLRINETIPNIVYCNLNNNLVNWKGQSDGLPIGTTVASQGGATILGKIIWSY